MSDNKRIAKNTAFLYIRMFLIMAVTLYTSRVILDKLGVEDYGLYNVVGGVVGMLSFLNGTLSIGSSRFITVALGKGDKLSLKETFSTAFYSHLGLAVILIFILETVGLWFVYNKLVIPEVRFTPAVYVYHISILTMVVNITQVPYTSVIMAHERMGIYAYISIIEALGKLGVCYLIATTSVDKLTMYALLLAFLQILTAGFYRLYCIKEFEETRIAKLFNRNIFKEMIAFSGWNIIANITEMLNIQGVVVLMNLFFSPVIVGAQAFASQMSTALMQFINNFRQAINPQIIKKYASRDYEGSKRLTLTTTVYVFDMVLLLGLPSILAMPKILNVWLVEVPDYTLFFCRWMIVTNILSTFSAALYIPMMAAGKVKTNSNASVILGIGKFVLLYVLWKVGFSVEWVQYLAVVTCIIYGFVVKPYILVNECEGYTYREIFECVWVCCKISFVAAILPFSLYNLIDMESLWQNILLVIVTGLTVSVSAILFMEQSSRQKLFRFALDKIKIHK